MCRNRIFCRKKAKKEAEQKEYTNTHVAIENTEIQIPNQNVSTGTQTTAVSSLNVNNNQTGIPNNINKGKVESRVVPEVLTPHPSTNNQINNNPNMGNMQNNNFTN